MSQPALVGDLCMAREDRFEQSIILVQQVLAPRGWNGGSCQCVILQNHRHRYTGSHRFTQAVFQPTTSVEVVSPSIYLFTVAHEMTRSYVYLVTRSSLVSWHNAVLDSGVMLVVASGFYFGGMVCSEGQRKGRLPIGIVC